MNKKAIIGIVIALIIIIGGVGAYFAFNQNTTTNTEENVANEEQEVESTAQNTEENSDEQNAENETVATNEEIENNNTTTGKKVLVAYFSWSGNTKDIAEYIQGKTNADIFEITPVTPYSTDYNTVGEVAKQERDENSRPEINNLPSNLDDYDTVFIGYPIWWHTAPMIIGTFLNAYDFEGVDVYPFTQSSSMDTEQFNNSINFVKENTKNGIVHDGLFARSSNTVAIDEYLQANGF